jgi:hypothetical protein
MFIFNITFTCYVLFLFFFLLSLVIYFRYSVFLFVLLWNKAFHTLHIITNDVHSVFLLNSFRRVWPMPSFLEGRNVHTVKPIFVSHMYCCTCARIQSQGAVSSLCHITIKYLFVSLFSWSTFLDSALMHGCYLEVSSPSDDVVSNASLHVLRASCASFFFPPSLVFSPDIS